MKIAELTLRSDSSYRDTFSVSSSIGVAFALNDLVRCAGKRDCDAISLLANLYPEELKNRHVHPADGQLSEQIIKSIRSVSRTCFVSAQTSGTFHVERSAIGDAIDSLYFEGIFDAVEGGVIDTIAGGAEVYLISSEEGAVAVFADGNLRCISNVDYSGPSLRITGDVAKHIAGGARLQMKIGGPNAEFYILSDNICAGVNASYADYAESVPAFAGIVEGWRQIGQSEGWRNISGFGYSVDGRGYHVDADGAGAFLIRPGSVLPGWIADASDSLCRAYLSDNGLIAFEYGNSTVFAAL